MLGHAACTPLQSMHAAVDAHEPMQLKEIFAVKSLCLSSAGGIG